ncbi:hypothetical protein WDV85_09615 [Pseudokineococcus sp. 5B2Z-1]|uniref:hypothetical protein n=1 Tax=Pseudokineococcus sp. 5B2Z-1 TaxID=3132744 RepID=UPI00309BB75F
MRARSAWTSSTVRGWYSEQDLRRHLRAALADEARRVGDADFGRGFRDAVALLDVPDPLDWANRVVELPGGGWVVTHLRFRLGDVIRPFVDVVATTAPPTPDGLALVTDTVLPTYAPFRPVSLRLEVPDGADLLAALGSDERFGRCGPALHVVAGRVEDLRRRPRALSYPSVRLRPADPGGAAERAEVTYAELAAGRPQSRPWAAAKSIASLSECAEQGLLFDVVVDGLSAGVVAAVRDDDHGLVGSPSGSCAWTPGTAGAGSPAAPCSAWSTSCPRAPATSSGAPSTPTTGRPCAAPSRSGARRRPRCCGSLLAATPACPPTSENWLDDIRLSCVAALQTMSCPWATERKSRRHPPRRACRRGAMRTNRSHAAYRRDMGTARDDDQPSGWGETSAAIAVATAAVVAMVATYVLDALVPLDGVVTVLPLTLGVAAGVAVGRAHGRRRTSGRR